VYNTLLKTLSAYCTTEKNGTSGAVELVSQYTANTITQLHYGQHICTNHTDYINTGN